MIAKDINHFINFFIKEINSSEDNILTRNKEFLKIKLFSLENSLNKKKDEIWQGDIGFKWDYGKISNEYQLRWTYCFKNKSNTIESGLYEFGINVFHSIIQSISKITSYQQYKDVMQKHSIYDRNRIRFESNKNILTYCILVWNLNLGEDDIEENDDVDKIALKILINFINIKEVLIEVLSKNKILKKCIFDNKIEKYLPVFPGVKCNEILGVGKIGERKLLLNKIEFKSDKSEECENIVKWKQKEIKNCDISEFKKYVSEVNSSKSIITISDYLKLKKEELIKVIKSLYEDLYKKIQYIQENNDVICLLSKDNVFIDLENNKLIFVTYYLNKKNYSGSYLIALQVVDSSYKLQSINEVGNYFWQAGYLLKDATELDDRTDLLDNSIDKKFLIYSFKRLTGGSIGSSYKVRSEKSFEKSVKRTLKNMEDFIKCVDEESKNKHLINSIILDYFISYRMNQENYDYGNGDIEYHIAKWVGACLSRYGFELNDLFKRNNIKADNIEINPFRMRRVVYTNYLLSIKVYNLLDNQDGLDGLELFYKGLLCSGIYLNIRIQVLEQIEMLSLEQRMAFIEKELPVDVFGFDDRVVLTIKNNSTEELKAILNDLLLEKFNPDIKLITPLGWILAMGFLLEVDEDISYIRGENKNREEIKKILFKLINVFLINDTKDEKGFPFDKLDEFFNKWSLEEFNRVYGILEQLDKKLNIEVQTVSSKYFNVSYMRDNVLIQLDTERLEKKIPFVSSAGLPKGNINIEKKGDCKIYTKSVCRNKILGISFIEDSLKRLIIDEEYEDTKAEVNDNIKSYSDIKEYTGKSKKDSIYNNEVNEEMLPSSEIKDKNEEKVDKDEQEIKGLDTLKSEYGYIEEIIKKEMLKLSELIKIRDDNWKTRSKRFDLQIKNIDRIALFQFNIDESSYVHPEVEKCHFIQNYLENVKKDFSVVEFRRRELLKAVLEACENFGVEILLLPEYSVRPETVKWLAEFIKDKKYSFSIWAGTFKVPPKSHIEFIDRKLQGGMYISSAVLPIVLNTATEKSFGKREDLNKVQIITERFKKYPSITLDEVINTVPALDGNFVPVMKKRFGETLFGDARDDVTELICAELFLMASPSNIYSFTKKSYDMYRNFAQSGKNSYEVYQDKTLKDIREFANYTSIYQLENKYYRTPIILVPADTTRAADYYVNGQASYLAAGLTTVFCNSSGNSAKGGSCFIGQNSWDDRRLRNKYESKINKNDEYQIKNDKNFIPKNTIYHGVQPGIYQQSCIEENRGALGVKEQALLICDVNPDISFKGSPNPESIMDSLSLVAHIPIIEDDIFLEECKKCSRKCFNKCERNIIYKKGTYKNIDLKQINENARIQVVKDELMILSKRKNYLYLDELYEHVNNNFNSTINDFNPKKIKEILTKLGIENNSDWLIKRGEAYLEQYKNMPQKWPPATVLDWLYVVVNYYDFFSDIEKLENGEGEYTYDYEIDIPDFGENGEE